MLVSLKCVLSGTNARLPKNQLLETLRFRDDCSRVTRYLTFYVGAVVLVWGRARWWRFGLATDAKGVREEC